MPFFNDADEAYIYLGGVFRKANETEVGPKLAAADIDLQVYYSDPEAKVLIKMHGESLEVVDGGENEDADVKLYMPADIGDKFWRGEYNLAVGLAKGQVKAKGPVNKILKLVPLTKPLFPMYRELVAEKDATVAA
ncbi:SCP2 sterol-binding domain-containing protein [Patulibacter brassicae]|jgi:putative sterol carrier protein|uniref:SCP2 sterol-binding domain-containing protein n=1 Tax=Patulibacter brassicae TaxID=1705717 RepID=A0ABU4VF03_9ACTN|nr:SCP2 sterol-binding domain-containing protein [Patulibacter brassicae]MDX8150401.1 SCP2 sterol-binding domain-containing protein [Patulibacter brassicae]